MLHTTVPAISPVSHNCFRSLYRNCYVYANALFCIINISYALSTGHID